MCKEMTRQKKGGHKAKKREDMSWIKEDTRQKRGHKAQKGDMSREKRACVHPCRWWPEGSHSV